MEARAHKVPYRQVPSSLGFHLVRAKLMAQQGTAKEAVAEFERLLRDKKHASEVATRYGYALALQRDGQLAAAQKQVATLARGSVSTAMTRISQRRPARLTMRYSRLRASMGSSLEARTAGYRPKNRPTPAVMPIPIATAHGSILAGMGEK